MHILVSNDDGVRAPGIRALAEAMLPFGKVTVVAPKENRSAIGHRKTMHKPLRIDPVPFPVAGVTAFAASDAPSDARRRVGPAHQDKEKADAPPDAGDRLRIPAFPRATP